LILFTCAILVAVWIGYLVTDRLCPGGYPRWLVLAFAPLTGLGICSLIVFFFRDPMFTVEGALLIVLLAFWFHKHGRSLTGWHEVRSWRIPILAVVFAVALGWSIGSGVVRVARYPNGQTDGWAIWNSHAKYMMAGGETWKQDLENTFHPDYGLLLPGAIVHTWRYIGHNSPDATGAVGIVFELAGIAVLLATLVKLRKRTAALLMAFVLLGSPMYFHYAVAEYADVPISVFMLCAIALLCLYEEDASNPIGLMALAGFMAGCAAWTKNEGLLFILVTSAVLFVPVFWAPLPALRRIVAFTAGLALPLAAIVYFKMAIAYPSDIFDHRNSVELMAKILNPDRHIAIASRFLTTGWSFGDWVFNPFIPILAFVGLSGVDRAITRRFGWRAGVATVVGLLVGYYAIYVITPLDLKYHLDSSMDRLLLHVWPGCLLLVGMAARSLTVDR
jgi:hypothetical protein